MKFLATLSVLVFTGMAVAADPRPPIKDDALKLDPETDPNPSVLPTANKVGGFYLHKVTANIITKNGYQMAGNIGDVYVYVAKLNAQNAVIPDTWQRYDVDAMDYAIANNLLHAKTDRKYLANQDFTGFTPGKYTMKVECPVTKNNMPFTGRLEFIFVVPEVPARNEEPAPGPIPTPIVPPAGTPGI